MYISWGPLCFEGVNVPFFLSPFFYNSCKFEPSCSTYALKCYINYNFVKATYKTFIRILKCNPWFKTGGHDPVKKGDG